MSTKVKVVRTSAVSGVVIGRSFYEGSESFSIQFDHLTIQKLRTTERVFHQIRIRGKYLIVYNEMDDGYNKIIYLLRNPSAKKVVKTNWEIENFGTMILHGKAVRK